MFFLKMIGIIITAGMIVAVIMVLIATIVMAS